MLNGSEIKIGILVWIYLSMLVSPGVVIAISERLTLNSEPLVVVLLGVVGITVASVGAWISIAQWRIIARFSTTWAGVLILIAGIVPMGLYVIQVGVFLFSVFSNPELSSTLSLLGFFGFLFGMIAFILGWVIIMYRNKLTEIKINRNKYDIEWTASWPHRDRLKLGLISITISGAFVALGVWLLGFLGGLISSQLSLIIILFISMFTNNRKYRVTAAGLEMQRNGRWLTSRHLIPWSEFEGFSVTGDALVLRQSFPYTDIRCSRSDISNESEVVSEIERYIS